MSNSKHVKTTTPTDADLKGNPFIGGGKGTTAAHATPDDLEASAGETTIEGDTANDTNTFGGVDKPGRKEAEHKDWNR